MKRGRESFSRFLNLPQPASEKRRGCNSEPQPTPPAADSIDPRDPSEKTPVGCVTVDHLPNPPPSPGCSIRIF